MLLEFKSVSFVNTFPVAGKSSLTVLLSSTATGGKLTGATKISKLAATVELPSLTVYEIIGTVPV